MSKAPTVVGAFDVSAGWCQLPVIGRAGLPARGPRSVCGGGRRTPAGAAGMEPGRAGCPVWARART
ncbi:hypothetical protein, partial [Streptomyces sp. EN27]|uniref:hypothetical protein n=1 Tax=Streptomyces sp. EN27 TaxID=211464 RepID=UPI001C40184A